MVFPPRLVAVVFIMLVIGLALCGCESASATSAMPISSTGCDYEYRSLLPSDWSIVSSIPIASDPPALNRCLVLYSYDLPAGTPLAPVRGIVFSRDLNRAKDIHAYSLDLPDRNFLGQYSVSGKLQDVVSRAPGPELVILDQMYGLTVQASIFQTHDITSSEDSLYHLLGWFRADGGIDIKMDEVVTRSRRLGTRSQLTDQYFYRASIIPHFITETVYSEIKAAKELTTIVPIQNPLDSEYPEKAVLGLYRLASDPAGYQSLAVTSTSQALSYLTLSTRCVPPRANQRLIVKDIVCKLPKDDPNDPCTIPGHLENVSPPIEAKVTVTSTCMAGDLVGANVGLTWRVRWDREQDRWMIEPAPR